MILLGLLLTAAAPVARGQIEVTREVPCCHFEGAGRVVWASNDTLLTFEKLAAYCGPVLWFSPDEPLLEGIQDPLQINIPMAFPFEDPSEGPVVYYRIRSVLRSGDVQTIHLEHADLNQSLLNLSQISAIDLDYFFYYPWEEGLGRHVHDVESVEMKLGIFRQPECDECRYAIVVLNVNAKAHGIRWYDNTLEVDEYTRFPIHILVEEGKHASCTDKNADGYFTPGYDVNKRVNDAGGVRDVMRTGAHCSGGFQSWFAKVRTPESRVFPPLPDDSLVREWLTENGEYAPGQPKYTLRPYPRLEAAKAHHDEHIVSFVDKGYDDWPEQLGDTDLRDLGRWMDEEGFVKSISVALRFDNEIGISIIFPLLIVKNINDPITGGWLVNRVYFKDTKLRDFGYNILYTTSASRWVDGYFAAGFEIDEEPNLPTKTSFVSETGIKFRFNLGRTPVVRHLSKLTDFWGFRAGIRYVGYRQFNELGYAIEIGAGSF